MTLDKLLKKLAKTDISSKDFIKIALAIHKLVNKPSGDVFCEKC